MAKNCHKWKFIIQVRQIYTKIQLPGLNWENFQQFCHCTFKLQDVWLIWYVNGMSSLRKYAMFTKQRHYCLVLMLLKTFYFVIMNSVLRLPLTWNNFFYKRFLIESFWNTLQGNNI
jgi:hypothetical protein